MKKVICVAVVLVVMLSSLTVNVSAESVSINDLCSLYTNYCHSSLSISNSTATCKSKVKGYIEKTTKIEITQSLEELLSNGWWYNHQSWSNTFYDWNVTYNTTGTIPHSGIYHLRTVAKVYEGSNNEINAVYSNNVIAL